MSEALRLNVGAGDRALPGWQNLDLPAFDALAIPWPFADGAVDELLLSHVLEHFTRDSGERVLSECARVLRRGGILHLAVPDLDKFIDYCDELEPWTRIMEWKYFGLDAARHRETVVTMEFPGPYQPGRNEPFYPVATPDSQALYRRYRERLAVELPQVIPGGRLGSYQYLNMDQAIAQAMHLVKETSAC